MTTAAAAAAFVVLAVVLLIGDRGAPAKGPDAGLGARLQRALDAAVRDRHAPGATAAVVRDGRLVFSGVAGRRNIDRGDPVEPQTRFITASAGKTVTAAMIFRLADAGKLSLDDRISRWLPQLPGARRIRIRNLLEHSSGLRDYLGSRSIERTIARHPAHRWTRHEVLASIQPPLKFRPGSRVSYSNSNYIALGAVIERVTGTSIQSAFMHLIARPLGLTDSSWVYDPSLYQDGARPYYERPGRRPAPGWRHGLVSTDYVGEVWTDGGLATTRRRPREDRQRIDRRRLLDPPSRRAMLRFRERGYGRGVFSIHADGRRLIGHDGLYGGFAAQHWTDPATGTTIAVLANLESSGRRPDAAWFVFKRLDRELGN